MILGVYAMLEMVINIQLILLLSWLLHVMSFVMPIDAVVVYSLSVLCPVASSG
jgi:hypothetical protein